MNQRQDLGPGSGGHSVPSQGTPLPAGAVGGQFGFAPMGGLAPINSFGGLPSAAQPSEVEASNSLSQELAAGNARATERNFAQALPHFLKAIKINPASAEAQSRAGYASWMLKNVDAALHHYKAAAQIEPANAIIHEALSEIYLIDGKGTLAVEHARKALELLPNDPEMAVSLGLALEANRQTDSAMQLVQRLFSQGYQSSRLAMLYASLADSSKRQEAVDLAQRVLQRGQFRSPEEPGSLEFTIASLLDKMGQYDQAFAHARRANELRVAKYDAQRFQALVDQLIGYFTRHRARCLPRASHGSRKPVFIVGMPRSGSSLIEQVLASHPSIHGGGELTWIDTIASGVSRQLGFVNGFDPHCAQKLSPRDLDNIAGHYLRPLEALNPSADRITDKMPGNFLYLGLIAMLFPQAVIIHSVRDPLDVCLSCYMNDLSFGYDYSYNLQSLGHYYRQYERLMAHWKSALDLPILDIRYENMVEDLEGQTRRMLQLIGLPWDQRCLQFHENQRFVGNASNSQIRQPLYKSSVQRWRRYEKHLAPLMAATGWG